MGYKCEGWQTMKWWWIMFVISRNVNYEHSTHS